jgi:hypothetical protein
LWYHGQQAVGCRWISLPKRLVLFLSQRDVAYPDADGRPRYAEDRRDLLDRIAAFFAELARLASLDRFQDRKQDSASGGR